MQPVHSGPACLDWLACVLDALTARQAIGSVHGNGTDSVLSQMLCHFKNHSDIVILNLQRAGNVGKLAIKGDVHNGTDDLSRQTNS